jgi:ribonuclease HI
LLASKLPPDTRWHSGGRERGISSLQRLCGPRMQGFTARPLLVGGQATLDVIKRTAAAGTRASGGRPVNGRYSWPSIQIQHDAPFPALVVAANRRELGPPAPPADAHLGWCCYFDGGSRRNPGIGGAGCNLMIDGVETWSCAIPLGLSTNNVAEYTGALAALRYALTQPVLPEKLTLRGDSELILHQLLGIKAVLHPLLRQLYHQCMECIDTLERRGCDVRISHVLRDLNKRADHLSNVAMDAVVPAAAVPYDAATIKEAIRVAIREQDAPQST